MRTAIILGRPHGKKSVEIISGVEVPAHEQAGRFKKLSAASTNEKYEHIELWYSDSGRTKQLKGLLTEKAQKERDEARKKADAEAKKKADAEAKANAETKPEAPKK